MSLRLRLASLWTPAGTLAGMQERVARATIAALDALLEERAPGRLASLKETGLSRSGGPAQRLAAMAAAQNERVKALVEALGRDEAVRLGREALFPVGKALGAQARRELSVGDGPADLRRAARVLYRSLGIHLIFEKAEDGALIMRVDRCALSHHYCEEACLILGAGDEGMVAGLSPKHAMRFEERMTTGNAECRARITEAGR